MKRKKIAILLTAVMIAGMAAGCGSGSESKKSDSSEDGKEVVLTWQSYDSYDKYEKVVDAFEKENPDIKIEFEEVSDFSTKILTEATAGDLPDLINCNTGTTQLLAESGALQKFDTEELEADEEK